MKNVMFYCSWGWVTGTYLGDQLFQGEYMSAVMVVVFSFLFMMDYEYKG